MSDGSTVGFPQGACPLHSFVCFGQLRSQACEPAQPAFHSLSSIGERLFFAITLNSTTAGESRATAFSQGREHHTHGGFRRQRKERTTEGWDG